MLKQCRILCGDKPYKERNSVILAYRSLAKELNFLEMKSSGKIHNRYIIIDNKTVFQLGGSIKQLGDNDDVITKIKNSEKIVKDFKENWLNTASL